MGQAGGRPCVNGGGQVQEVLATTTVQAQRLPPSEGHLGPHEAPRQHRETSPSFPPVRVCYGVPKPEEEGEGLLTPSL